MVLWCSVVCWCRKAGWCGRVYSIEYRTVYSGGEFIDTCNGELPVVMFADFRGNTLVLQHTEPGVTFTFVMLVVVDGSKRNISY